VNKKMTEDAMMLPEPTGAVKQYIEGAKLGKDYNNHSTHMIRSALTEQFEAQFYNDETGLLDVDLMTPAAIKAAMEKTQSYLLDESQIFIGGDMSSGDLEGLDEINKTMRLFAMGVDVNEWTDYAEKAGPDYDPTQAPAALTVQSRAWNQTQGIRSDAAKKHISLDNKADVVDYAKEVPGFNDYVDASKISTKDNLTDLLDIIARQKAFTESTSRRLGFLKD
jgi:hypothetical protein